ncbi:hypothetical protein KCU93_g264, partial [Aureobasidium melanogenum]
MIRCFAPEAQLCLPLKYGSIEVADASASLIIRQDDDEEEFCPHNSSIIMNPTPTLPVPSSSRPRSVSRSSNHRAASSTDKRL